MPENSCVRLLEILVNLRDEVYRPPCTDEKNGGTGSLRVFLAVSSNYKENRDKDKRSMLMTTSND